MRKYCHGCASALRGLRLRRPFCHRSTVGRLHVALIAVLVAAGLIYFLKLT
jgi:hypothetical protein